MCVVETGQMSAVETRQMCSIKTGQSPVAMVDICLVSTADICSVSTAGICPVSTEVICPVSTADIKAWTAEATTAADQGSDGQSLACGGRDSDRPKSLHGAMDDPSLTAKQNRHRRMNCWIALCVACSKWGPCCGPGHASSCLGCLPAWLLVWLDKRLPQ